MKKLNQMEKQKKMDNQPKKMNKITLKQELKK